MKKMSKNRIENQYWPRVLLEKLPDLVLRNLNRPEPRCSRNSPLLSEFSEDEEKRILAFIRKNNAEGNVKDDEIWKEMEANKVFKHPWIDVKRCYLSHILYLIKAQNKSDSRPFSATEEQVLKNFVLSHLFQDEMWIEFTKQKFIKGRPWQSIREKCINLLNERWTIDGVCDSEDSNSIEEKPPNSGSGSDQVSTEAAEKHGPSQSVASDADTVLIPTASPESQERRKRKITFQDCEGNLEDLEVDRLQYAYHFSGNNGPVPLTNYLKNTLNLNPVTLKVRILESDPSLLSDPPGCEYSQNLVSESEDEHRSENEDGQQNKSESEEESEDEEESEGEEKLTNDLPLVPTENRQERVQRWLQNEDCQDSMFDKTLNPRNTGSKKKIPSVSLKEKDSVRFLGKEAFVDFSEKKSSNNDTAYFSLLDSLRSRAVKS